MTKLNLGSHNKYIDGYTNVDALDLVNVDVVHDLTMVPYPFADCSIEEIVLMEVLEHIPFKHAHNVLKECYRILEPGGVLHIQVPDIGEMCRMYINKEICDCVPRKAKRYEDYKADPKCNVCHGKAKIHTGRWRVAFAGAQKHEFDTHMNHYTNGILKHDLEEVGFEVTFKDNIYKLCVDAVKKKLL